jgi:hypothetical protein
MPTLAIGRLTARAPPGRGGAVAARALDALRLAAPDERRLLLIRQLRVGALPRGADAVAWQAHVAARLDALRARAVHGASPGAAAAEAVWFACAEEARRLLLLELAAGRAPRAWFWALAVPDWRGLDLSMCLERVVAAAAMDARAAVMLAHAFVPMVRAGALPALLRAVAAAGAQVSGVVGLVAPRARGTARADAAETAAARAGVARIWAQVPADVAPVLRAGLVDASFPVAVRQGLARLGLVAVSPDLAGQRAAADAMAAVLLEFLTDDAGSAGAAIRHLAPAPVTPGTADTAALARDGPPPRAGPAPDIAPDGAAASVTPAATRLAVVPAQARRIDEADAAPVHLPAREEASPLAGLFLLLGPLARMGLPGWTEQGRDAARAGLPRALLGAIAARHAARLPPHAVAGDPVLRLFADRLSTEAWAVAAWRVGLDRWLRRRTGRRLADIVRRRGWLLAGAETVALRYPLAAADLALRRRALDVDPGFLPWLGWTVRFQFRDEPMA